MDAEAYLRGHPRARAARERRGHAGAARSPTRSSAEPSRTGAWTDRAFRGGRAAPRLDGRERARRSGSPTARCSGAGPPTTSSPRSPGAAAAASTPPRSPRCGSASTSCCSPTATPDHAAVDQAVELAKGDAPDGGPARGAGLVNAVLRRAAARARRAARGARRLDPGRGRDRPLDPALARRAVVGGARRGRGARSLLAAMQRAGGDRASGSTRCAPTRRRSRPTCAPPGSRSRAPGAGGLLAPADCLVVETAGEPVGARVGDRRADPAVARLAGRGRGARPAARRAGARPLRRARDQDDGQIAARMGDRGEVVSVELDPRRAAEVAAQAPALGLTQRHGSRSPTRPRPTSASGFDRVLVDPPCSDLGTLASRPDARWRKSPERRSSASPRCSAGCWCAAARALRPGGALVYSTCTISRRENEDGRGRARRVRGRRGAGRALGRRARGSPSRADPRFLQLLPDRDSHHRLLHRPLPRRATADGRRRAAIRAARRARAAASPGCARRSSRAASAASTACAATSSSRSAPTAASTRRSSRMSADRGPALPALRPLDAEARMSAATAADADRRAGGSRRRSSRPTSRGSATAGRRGDGRRRAGDPRRRDGRPLRPADHDRAAGRRRRSPTRSTTAGGALDVHLMIERPERQIAEFAARRRRLDHLPRRGDRRTRNRTLAAIRERGCLAGIALNPGTPAEALAELARRRRPRPLHDASTRAGAASRSSTARRRRSRALAAARRRAPRSRSTAASTPTTAGRVADAGATLLRRRLGDLRQARSGRRLRRDRRRGRRCLARAAQRPGGAGAVRAPASLLPPGPLGRGDPRRGAARRSHQSASAAAAADREQVGAGRPRSGRRRARPARRCRRGGCAARSATGTPSIGSGAAGSPSSARRGRTEKTCGRAARRQRGERSASPIGPSRQRPVSSSTSSRGSPRTRMWSSSPPRARSSRVAGAPRRRGRSR